jgi:hypothetical protein
MLRLAMLATATAALVACGSSTKDTDTGVKITLTSNEGLSYTGPAKIGGQTEQVILDTGSTTLGVAATGCSNCGVSPLYTPGASAVDQHQTGSSQYADSSGWSGEIYQDSVELGTAGTVQLKFVAINSSSGFFRDLSGSGSIGYQGILGFAPDEDLITGTTSYITTLFGSGSATTDQFAFQLCPDTGTMTIGGVDESSEAAPPVFTPMVTNSAIGGGSYVVNTARMALGTGSDVGDTNDFGPTIIDTGTSVAFIPAGPLNALQLQIQSSSGYTAVFGSQSLGNSTGCVTTAMTSAEIDAAMPPLHIAFPDSTGTASAFIDLAPTRSYLFFAGTMGGQNGYCFAFEDSSQLVQGLSLSLFGDTMLASFVSIFDLDTQEMGFAKEAGCHESGTAAALREAPAYQPGRPWWQQDPRVRVPSAAALQKLASRFVAH